MIWYILGFFVLVAAVAWGIGASLPARHRLAKSILLGVPIGRAWEVITDIPGQITWRTNLDSVKPATAAEGEEAWEETLYRRSQVFHTVEATPPTRFVRETRTGGAAFIGRWTFLLEALGETECRVTLTEEGEIRHPLSRLFAKWFGADLFIRQYLMELALYLGEPLPRWDEAPANEPPETEPRP